ncbi:MAG: ATPase domain [Actinomycetota bacterium]|nr:ATPase domain [Actinomycetota bacterium]
MTVIAGRTAEVGILDGFLADRLAEPRSLLIEGAPGIGKTTLLRALLDLAHERQYAVGIVTVDGGRLRFTLPAGARGFSAGQCPPPLLRSSARTFAVRVFRPDVTGTLSPP